MLKPSAIRTFSTLGRRPFWRRSRPPEHGTIQIQRVHVSKPPLFTVRRATRTILYVGPALLIWHFFSPIQIDVEFDKKQGADGSVKAGPDEEDEEKKYEEVDEEATFLPMTWPKKLPRMRYSPADPEPQAMKRFQGDGRRQKDVKERFVQVIRRYYGSPQLYGSILGEVDTQRGGHMVWFRYPRGPPPDYGVSGLLISEEFIGWATKVIPEDEYGRMKAAILPTGALHSFYTISKIMLKRLVSQNDSIGGKAGISADKGAEKEQPRSLGEQLRKGASTGSSPDQITARGNEPASPSKDPQTPTADSTRISVFPSLSSGNPTPPTHLPRFLRSFRRPNSGEIPRGCIAVDGLVELRGSKMSIRIQAYAFYNLKTNHLHLYRAEPRL